MHSNIFMFFLCSNSLSHSLTLYCVWLHKKHGWLCCNFHQILFKYFCIILLCCFTLCVCVCAALAMPFLHRFVCVCEIYGMEFIFLFLLFKKDIFISLKYIKNKLFYDFLFFGVDCLEGYSLRDDGFYRKKKKSIMSFAKESVIYWNGS